MSTRAAGLLQAARRRTPEGLLSRLGLRVKLLLIGGIGVVCILTLTVLTWVGVGSIEGSNANALQATQAADSFESAELMVSQTKAAQRSYVMDVHALGARAAQDDMARRGEFLATAAKAQAVLKDIPREEMPAEPRAALDKVAAGLDEFLALDAQAAAAYRQGGDAGMTAGDAKLDEATAAFTTLSGQLSNLHEAAVTATQQSAETAAAAASMLRIASLVALVVSVAAIGAVAWFVMRQILRSVTDVRATLRAMQRGDLTVPVTSRSRDEIGQLATASEDTRNAMREVIEAVAAAATTVSGSAARVQELASSVNEGSERTSRGLTQVSTGVGDVSDHVQTVSAGTEEMTGSIREISRNAADAAAVAASAVQLADQANATVSTLGQSSVEISEVVKAITSIAEQTNLLALNATIEAARAGEAGKGFAVVANEVKELALETSRATEDITNRIGHIQDDTDTAVAVIAEISTVIARINDTQSTIASAVEEQTATTNEMSRHVGDVASGSRSIAATVAQAAQEAEHSARATITLQESATDMAGESSRLQELVGRFRY